MRTMVLVGIAGLMLGACAGRDAQPVAMVQQHDQASDCASINAEIQANNVRVEALASERGMKIAQNVAAGAVGLVIWPVLFAMDSKGAAGTEIEALQARQQYLGALAERRCAAPPPPPPPPPPSPATPRAKR